jgi:hypothetical protein
MSKNVKNATQSNANPMMPMAHTKNFKHLPACFWFLLLNNRMTSTIIDASMKAKLLVINDKQVSIVFST